MSNNGANLRHLFGEPVLLQDWDDHAEEASVEHWELFLDLLLVAASGAIADEFQENLTLHGFLQFVVFFFIMINAWILYTHHYESRFTDASFVHSLVLCPFFCGFGLCIVSASYEDAKTFAIGALIQRASVLIMFASVALSIPRAIYFCTLMATVTAISCSGLITVLLPSRLTIPGLWIAAIVETVAEILLVGFVDIRRLIPVNIEHSKERFGALVLIMLGETVLSVTIRYNELKNQVVDEYHSDVTYHLVLIVSILLTFMFALLYFHVEPQAGRHASTRSRFHGSTFLVLTRFLGLAVLTIGVSVKCIVSSILLNDQRNLEYVIRLQGISVGSGLILLFGIRVLHHGGKRDLQFGEYILHMGDNPVLDRVVNTWWWTFALASLLPFFMSLTMKDPVLLMSSNAMLLFLLCIMESSFVHFITIKLKLSYPVHQPVAEEQIPFSSAKQTTDCYTH
jgi:low temperature requirement protein LtrA